MNKPSYILEQTEREKLPSGMVLEEGTFVVEKQNAGAFLNQGRKSELVPFRYKYTPPMEYPIKAGDRVLFIRPGGYGDLLFCTPIFRELKARFCQVRVACFPQFAEVLHHNPDVDAIVPYPLSLADWNRADKHVWLERILEDGIKGVAETMTDNAIDLIARASGVTLEDKSMRYVITEDERHEAAESFPKGGRPRVGVQLTASARNRSYPAEQLEVACALMAREGFEVFLFGHPGQLKECNRKYTNLTAENLTFRQSCALVATCDAMVTPDSSLCHVAAALNIPTLALYGPFLSQTRTQHSKSVLAINGKAPCAPCFGHDNTGLAWPEGCPGWQTGRCEALASIHPTLISAQISQWLRQPAVASETL